MAKESRIEKKELIRRIHEMDSIISPLFYEIMDYEEISVYKEKLIQEKIYLLTTKMNGLIDYTNAYLLQEADEITKKQKRFFRTLIILFILSIVFPFLGIFTLIYFSNTTDKLKQLINDLKNDDCDVLVNEVSTILENCQTFLDAKVKKRKENLAEESDRDINYRCIVVANYILNIYLNTDVLLPITNSVREILVKMLQEELQVSEADLEELLKMAKVKVAEETLTDELKLSRKSSKNSEF